MVIAWTKMQPKPDAAANGLEEIDRAVRLLLLLFSSPEGLDVLIAKSVERRNRLVFHQPKCSLQTEPSVQLL